MGTLKEDLETWNRRTKERFPDVDSQVLQFITDMVSCAAKNGDEYEVVRSMFHAGYCWHFATMLKNTFKRGEVCWAAPLGHFVWVDDNGVPYDVEGANFGEQDYHIPESYLGDALKDFMHIPGETYSISKEEIVDIIRKYEDDNNLPHKDYTEFMERKDW